METQNTANVVKLPLTLRPDWFTYFLGGALSLLLWLPITSTFITLGRVDWKLVFILTGITAILFLLIHGCRITASEDGLTYSRLFIWSRFLPYDQMEKLKIETSLFRSRNPKNRNKPVYRLTITPRTQKHDALTINIKLFSRRGLSNLMKIISNKAPAAYLDKRCEQMKSQLMPSILGDEMKMRSRSKILDFLLKER